MNLHLGSVALAEVLWWALCSFSTLVIKKYSEYCLNQIYHNANIQKRLVSSSAAFALYNYTFAELTS